MALSNNIVIPLPDMRTGFPGCASVKFSDSEKTMSKRGFALTARRVIRKIQNYVKYLESKIFIL
jgi:hypothetical protein